MSKNKNFTMIPNEVFGLFTTLSKDEFSLLLVMYHLGSWNNETNKEVNLADLMSFTGYSWWKANNIAQSLASKGMIDHRNAGNKKHVYAISRDIREKIISDSRGKRPHDAHVARENDEETVAENGASFIVKDKTLRQDGGQDAALTPLNLPEVQLPVRRDF